MVKSILLIGRVNSGKSTLANLLLNKENEFEEGVTPGTTQNIKSKELELNGSKYQIIDTVGMHDGNLTVEQFKEKVIEVYNKLKKDRLVQVLFVMDKRFNEKELDVYKEIKHLFFGDSFAGYITIVRSNFDDFRNEEIWKEDIEGLKKKFEKGGIKILGKKVGKNTNLISSNEVVHVSNPSLDPDICRDNEEKDLNKKDREYSRQRLFEDLSFWQKQEDCEIKRLSDEEICRAAIQINNICKQM